MFYNISSQKTLFLNKLEKNLFKMFGDQNIGGSNFMEINIFWGFSNIFLYLFPNGFFSQISKNISQEFFKKLFQKTKYFLEKNAFTQKITLTFLARTGGPHRCSRRLQPSAGARKSRSELERHIF